MSVPARPWTSAALLFALLSACFVVTVPPADAAGVLSQATPLVPEPDDPPTTPGSVPAAETPSGETPASGDVESAPVRRVYTVAGPSRVRIGGSITIERGEHVGDVVAVLGGATVRGEVTGDVVAVGGDVRVEDGASVTGKLVTIGGQLYVSPTATVSPHSERVAVGFPEFRVFAPGEPDVTVQLLPDLSWLRGAALTLSTARLTLLLFVCLLAATLFRQTVDGVADQIASAPFESLFAGVGVQLVALPAVLVLSLALAVTLVGLPLVPLGLLLLGLLWAAGFAGAATAIGRGVLRLVGVRRAPIGPALLLGMLPVLGFTLASRLMWWDAQRWDGGIFAAALLGGLFEGILWTLGAGAGLLTLLRGVPSSSASTPPTVAPPTAPAVPVQF